jgi:hypothetical protein
MFMQRSVSTLAGGYRLALAPVAGYTFKPPLAPDEITALATHLHAQISAHADFLTKRAVAQIEQVAKGQAVGTLRAWNETRVRRKSWDEAVNPEFRRKMRDERPRPLVRDELVSVTEDPVTGRRHEYHIFHLPPQTNDDEE